MNTYFFVKQRGKNGDPYPINYVTNTRTKFKTTRITFEWKNWMSNAYRHFIF